MSQKYILLATTDLIAEAFKREFASFPEVTIYKGLFEELKDVDCLVSPANSFGLMDGGMDAAITRYFGDQLQKRVQAHIIKEYGGEQPVGTSFIIETNNERIKYIAHSPTMRCPSIIRNTDNIYRATKATLLALKKYEDSIQKIAIPAFGAGVGMVPADNVSKQMALAFKHISMPPESIDWIYARIRDREIKEVSNIGNNLK